MTDDWTLAERPAAETARIRAQEDVLLSRCDEVVVCSAALAASKGWRPLVTPGILVGMFGYAIATFTGIGLTALLD